MPAIVAGIGVKRNRETEPYFFAAGLPSASSTTTSPRLSARTGASILDRSPTTTHTIQHLQPGDVLLACSDGVWHYFSPTELASVVDSLSPREATEFLIDKARSRARGGGDNLSLVVVKIEALEEEKKMGRLSPISSKTA